MISFLSKLSIFIKPVLYIGTVVHTHARTHTRTHTFVLVLVFTTARTGYVAPIKGGEPAGGNKTGGPVGSRDTSLISTSAWPPQCIEVLIYGLARPMR